jgi:hypothetical protein
MSGRAFWIDFDNSPHVPLFVPVIENLERRGFRAVLTARDHSQTLELLEAKGLLDRCAVIGHHSGGRLTAKLIGLGRRSALLREHIRGQIADGLRIGAALSHGSRAMVVAARRMRIPAITMYDYEFTETRLFNWLSDVVLVPDAVNTDRLREIGARLAKCATYPGMKEEVYVNRFAPTPGFRSELSRSTDVPVPADALLVLVRPPATTANYHDPRSEAVLAALFGRIANEPGLFAIVVARTREQESELRRAIAARNVDRNRIAFLIRAVNGLDLIAASDVVISGGGTMNREAALLGKTVYSIFSGKRGALDEILERRGQIRFINDPAEIAGIDFSVRPPQLPPAGRSVVESIIVDHVRRFLEA